MKITILNNHLGRSPSKDELDNLQETQSVERALRSLKFNVDIIPFSFNIQKAMDSLRKSNPDVVFNLVESIEGNDSLAYFAPAILESLKIPYTGCPAEAIYNTTSKVNTKKIFQMNDIPTPRWATLNELTSASHQLRKRQIIVKHLWEHASEDIDESSVFLAGDEAKLRETMRKRKNLESYFAEEFIDGREFNISLLEEGAKVRTLPPAEMTFLNYPKGKAKIIDYKAKWEEDSFEYKNTVRTFDFKEKDKELMTLLKKISKKTWDVFGLKGYARVDFRVDKQGRPYVLEINTNPCISPDSGFIAACAKEGMDYKEAIYKIIKGVTKE
jgi:D-alanine-D-alanine ligase